MNVICFKVVSKFDVSKAQTGYMTTVNDMSNYCHVSEAIVNAIDTTDEFIRQLFLDSALSVEITSGVDPTHHSIERLNKMSTDLLHDVLIDEYEDECQYLTVADLQMFEDGTSEPPYDKPSINQTQYVISAALYVTEDGTERFMLKN